MKTIKASDEFKVGKNKIGYIWDSFTKEFGNDKITPGKALKFQKLTKTMIDSEIMKEFGVQECTLGDVLATMKSATEDMKDGYSNIFYVKGHPSHVVVVYWGSGDGKWRVCGWLRGGLWLADERVFSPATSGAKALSSSPESALTLDDAVKMLKKEGYVIYKPV